MIEVRPSEERGRSGTSWLDSRHSFSFADYRDPRHMGFRSLRVINEDRIAPASGFGAHPHRDMEIVTVPLAGRLAHRDSEGGVSELRAGRVQRMTAGRGIVHSEVNPSPDEPLHLLQIWILPDRHGLAPGYEERDLEPEAGPLTLIASPEGRDGSLRIHADARVHRLLLGAGEKLGVGLEPGRHAWLQVIRGSGEVNGVAVAAGDGAGISGETRLDFVARDDLEALLFDLA